jgi:imidazolonepropionase
LNEVGLIPDGALLIRDGVLLEVGPTRRLENLAEARGAEDVNAAGRVVMPGFVDSHTHLAFPPPGADEGVEKAAGLIRATNSQRLEMRVRSYLQSMARHGATTVEVKTGCGPDASAETKILRVLAALKQDPLDVVPTFLFRLPASGDGGIEPAADAVFRDLMPKLKKRRMARFVDLAWEGGPALQEYYVRFLAVARSLGFACKVHADQAAPRAAITAAVEQFAVSVDHLEHATAAEAALLAGSCTTATLLPCASFHGGGPSPPARALIDSGAAVALATNFNPLHTPTLNPQTVVALASMRLGLTAAEAISAATINGAHALGRADRTGSLERGKLADLLILNASDYRDLARDFGGNLVHRTMKHGEFIYTEGEVRGRDDGLRHPLSESS